MAYNSIFLGRGRGRRTGVKAVCTVFILTAALALGGAVGRATLIVVVPTKDGMAVFSDKLMTIKGFGKVDGMEKVRLLSPTAAVGFAGVIGSSRWTAGETNLAGQELFAVDLAQAYFVTNRVEDFDGQAFADSMKEQLSSYFARKAVRFDLPADPGCLFLVFRTTPDHRRRTFVAHMQFVQGATNLMVGSADCKEFVQRDGDRADILAFGQPDLPVELKRGKDERFDELRSNWMIAKYLPKPPWIKDSDLADAEVFGRQLLEAASEKTILLNTNAAIGGTMDETILAF